MRASLWAWLLALSGVAGAVLTFVLVETWSPDAGLRLPHGTVVGSRAARDAAALGLDVEGEPAIRPSAGPARASSTRDLAILHEDEPDWSRRRERMQAAPPLRLGARFPEATSPGGRQGELLLEYGGAGQLVGASFGFDSDAPVWMRQGVRTVFSGIVADALLGPEPPTYRAMPRGLAERLVHTLVGPDAPNAQVVEGANTREEICQTTPGRYVYWRNDGRWLAHMQPVAYAAVGRATGSRGGAAGGAGGARYYGTLLAALAALLLVWRAFRQTRKLGRMDVRAVFLAVGLLPLLPCLSLETGLVATLAPPVVISIGVGLVWYLAETTLRGTRPTAVDDWDRFLGGRSVITTGHRLLGGFAAGSFLAAWLVGGPAALEHAGSALGQLRGGYGTVLVILPEYAWLPSSLSQGLAVGAVTAALVGVALRFAGLWGVVGGTLASGLVWAAVSPAWPPVWALVSGLVAAVGASLVLMRLGLLAHLAACVTALSLPTLAVALLALPQLWVAGMVATLPALLLAAGLVMSLSAPGARPGESPLSELKTLLLCDLVDSTAMVQDLGDSKAAELFSEHDHVARGLLQRFGGREIDKTDGFLLVFDRPIQAVRFAVEYNRALDRLSDKVGVEMATRVGIHFGEVFVRRNPPEDVARGAKPMEIEGLAKPVAARLMSLAQARQALLTRAAFDLARRAAVSEMTSTGPLRWRAHGKYHVKGMDEAVEVFEVSEENLAPLSAPSNSEKAWREPDTNGSGQGTNGSPDNALAEGAEIGHYRIEGIAGRGAMGEVYEARDQRLGRRVAVKALPDHLAFRSDTTTRFHREARALAVLDHPNIVTVFSVEEREGRPYMIMELVEGENLGALMPSGGMSCDDFYGLAVPLANALAAAHAKGITHRDLKPSNIMVGADGRLKVLDFGLARATIEPFGAGEDDSLGFGSSPERVLGTVPYMSPEQLRGSHVDFSSDVFSLGVLFFEMLSGHRPFSGESTADLVSAILRDTPPSLLELKVELPGDLAGIVARCLKKAPEERYQTGAGLLDALTAAHAHEDAAPDYAGASSRGADG